MRWLTAFLWLLLAGCHADPVTLTAIAVGSTAGSVAVIQRTPIDAVWSLLSGRDCSAVRLDRGESYCRPMEQPPEQPAYCTRSLGVADCWRDPAGQPREQADGPRTLTPLQEANRIRRWPF